jgi:hypothetical protein
MCYEGLEVATHDAMPCRAVFHVHERLATTPRYTLHEHQWYIKQHSRKIQHTLISFEIAFSSENFSTASAACFIASDCTALLQKEN